MLLLEPRWSFDEIERLQSCATIIFKRDQCFACFSQSKSPNYEVFGPYAQSGMTGETYCSCNLLLTVKPETGMSVERKIGAQTRKASRSSDKEVWVLAQMALSFNIIQ